MAITLKIENGSTFTNMKVFRSTDPNTLYDQAPLADIAGDNTWTDTTAVPGSIYYYGFRLTSALGQLSQLVPLKVKYESGWGPATAAVATRLASTGNPCYQGDSNFGLIANLIAGETQYPSHANVTNWSTFASTASGLAAASFTVTGTIPAGRLLYYDSKIIVVRDTITAGLSYQLSATGPVITAAMQKIAEYLETVADGSTTYNVGGYNWRLRAASVDMVSKSMNSWAIPTVGAACPVPVFTQAMRSAYEATGKLWANTLGQANAQIFVNNPNATDYGFTTQSGTSSGSLLMHYFELVP